ncbi:MAG: glycosyltransferase family 9 protein [Campylobacteraceae bacterium]|jgi:heptosyltransferase-2|nr:glycosyltransferase family 9 protein [Campylobacteraceae bacterium]
MIELDNKKILVTFLMHLGDLILVTPFIRALRKAAPNSYITMLVDDKLKDVVMFNPNLNQVITIDKKGRDNTIMSLVKCAKDLSSQNFDMVINLHPNERCSFICTFTKTAFRTGTSHALFRWRWDRYIKLDRTLHAADMYLEVLKKLGIRDISNNGLEIFPSSAHFKEADNFWHLNGVKPDDKLVGFNIGSAVITKRWANERFAKVADILTMEGYKIVFFGGKMDMNMVDNAASCMRTNPIIATGNFSIGALAAAMRRCSLIITNDSGPMHVAISQKTPIVALYGPSNPKLYGPYTKNAIVVKANPPCDGCKKGMRHTCNDLQCMKRLTVEQVIKASEKMLKKNKKAKQYADI